jgi:cytochrome d ubiquinol oxidase subunit I
VGRQPWVVYGLLRTREAVTPSLHASDVTISLLVYIAAYIVIFGAGLYFLLRLVRAGFAPREGLEPHGPIATPARPLSAATRAQ